MAKIIVFVPEPGMLQHAEDIISEKQLDAKAVYTDSAHILSILKRERARGTLAVVARGRQAHVIKENSDIPLSEIVISGQELALLLGKAKELCESPDDKIGLIGFYSMFSDVRPIAQALGVNVKVYCATSSNTVEDVVRRACEEGAKLIIGGDLAVRFAEGLGMKTLFLAPLEGSLSAAIDGAQRIVYGIEMEQKKTAEFMSLMNYTFDAIIRLDREGIVTMVNSNAELAFHMPQKQMTGRYIFDLLDAQEESLIKQAVFERREVHAAVVRIGDTEYIANLASLGGENSFEGFILSMQSLSQTQMAKDEHIEWTPPESSAKHRLEEYRYPSKAMTALRRDAEHIAQFDLPMLITGAYGSDMGRLAEAIHNAGARADKPFVRLNLADIPAQMQQQCLSVVSGTRTHKTVFELALSGTVLIEHIELLTAQMQPYLTYICKRHWVLGSNLQPAFPIDCRIMATTSVPLEEEVKSGRFLQALYGELSRLVLRVPPLGERADDLAMIIDERFQEITQQHKKEVRFDRDERRMVQEMAWPGDEQEMARFIEKLVLFAADGVIDGELIERLKIYNNLTKAEAPAPGSTATRSAEETELVAMIDKYRGNREQIANALGISKTTLWRKLKKYGLIRG